MDAGVSTARQARTQHRHELRTLAYVTLDQENGGIIRNLSQHGIGAQMVAAVRPKQQLRVRFELRYPRLQVETRAEVVWSTFSGQCGIRFLEMPAALKRQINEWILGDLLDRISVHTEHSGSIFSPKIADSELAQPTEESVPADVAEDDGLMVSATPVKVIELPSRAAPPAPSGIREASEIEREPSSDVLDWLSQPLSGRTLAWTVDALVVIASQLLFTLIFLWMTGEAPRWPLVTTAGASLMMVALYWAFFRVLAGESLGTRLARIAEAARENEGNDARFR
jgi:hypothetical protein